MMDAESREGSHRPSSRMLHTVATGTNTVKLLKGIENILQIEVVDALTFHIYLRRWLG